MYGTTAECYLLGTCVREIMQDKDSPAMGVELWNQDVDDLYEKYQGDLQALLNDYKSNQIYTHPVKLSRWK